MIHTRFDNCHCILNFCQVYVLGIEEVGGSNPGCEISSLPDRNLPGGHLPHVLWHWHVSLLSHKKIKKIGITLKAMGFK